LTESGLSSRKRRLALVCGSDHFYTFRCRFIFVHRLLKMSREFLQLNKRIFAYKNHHARNTITDAKIFAKRTSFHNNIYTILARISIPWQNTQDRQIYGSNVDHFIRVPEADRYCRWKVSTSIKNIQTCGFY